MSKAGSCIEIENDVGLKVAWSVSSKILDLILTWSTAIAWPGQIKAVSISSQYLTTPSQKETGDLMYYVITKRALFSVWIMYSLPVTAWSKVLMLINVHPCQKKWFCTNGTCYISLPNYNKHEEIDGKNTQIASLWLFQKKASLWLLYWLGTGYIRSTLHLLRNNAEKKETKVDFRQFQNKTNLSR